MTKDFFRLWNLPPDGSGLGDWNLVFVILCGPHQDSLHFSCIPVRVTDSPPVPLLPTLDRTQGSWIRFTREAGFWELALNATDASLGATLNGGLGLLLGIGI